MAEDLEQRVRAAIAATFGLAPEDVGARALQAEVPGWDSVGHLNLMLMLEDTFGVRLDVPDMERLTGVEAIVRFLEER